MGDLSQVNAKSHRKGLSIPSWSAYIRYMSYPTIPVVNASAAFDKVFSCAAPKRTAEPDAIDEQQVESGWEVPERVIYDSPLRPRHLTTRQIDEAVAKAKSQR
jgi:hypothetical protein